MRIAPMVYATYTAFAEDHQSKKWVVLHFPTLCHIWIEAGFIRLYDGLSLTKSDSSGYYEEDSPLAYKYSSTYTLDLSSNSGSYPVVTRYEGEHKDEKSKNYYF